MLLQDLFHQDSNKYVIVKLLLVPHHRTVSDERG